MTEDEQTDKKREIDDRKQLYIFARVSGISFLELAEGNKACKRGDECTRTADVNAHKKLTVVIGELRKQDSCRDVADELTRKRADEKRIFLKNE